MPWYDTSWLWDWVSYLLVARFGLIGLQLLTLLVLAVALAAAGAACVDGWLLPALVFLLIPRLTVRPHVATWAAVAVVLALCTRAKDWRWRAACVPVTIVNVKTMAEVLRMGKPHSMDVLRIPACV